MRKIVFDVDDTLWQLNKRIAAEIGLDYNKITVFSAHDNPNLTNTERNALLSAYADSKMFENIEWDASIEKINVLQADIYINSNNSTQEIADLKRTQLHNVLNINDDHIIMNIVGNDKSNITKKYIGDDVYILVDDSPHNIEMSKAKFNIVIKRPWNEHCILPKAKPAIFVDTLDDAIRLIELILT